MEMIRSLLNQTNAPRIVVTNTPIMETILRRLGLWERSRSEKQWAVKTSPGQLREQQRREFHPKFTSDAVNFRWWSPGLRGIQAPERQAPRQAKLLKSEVLAPAISWKLPAVHLFQNSNLFCTLCLRVYRCYANFRPRTQPDAV